MDSTAQAQWANHFTVKSESSSRLYTIARRVSGKDADTWACECPGFKAHKRLDPQTGRVTCKHLLAAVLPGPYPAETPAKSASVADTRRAFSDAAYDHYDPAVEGFGNPDDWFQRAEQAARGRGYYRGRAGERTDTGTGRGRRQQGRTGGQRQRSRQEQERERDWRQQTSYAPPTGTAADLRLLGLDAMPAHVEQLKKAMREMAKKMHPNYQPHLDTHEGRKAFTAMFDAYERLLRFY